MWHEFVFLTALSLGNSEYPDYCVQFSELRMLTSQTAIEEPARFVFSGSSAADAGLKAGDVVLAVDQVPVRIASMLTDRLHAARVGDTLRAWLDETAGRKEMRVKDEHAHKLDAFIRRRIEDWSLTGLAVAVVKNDQVAFIRGYGVSDVRTKAPVDEHTVFQLGSCTKPLTATAIARLVEDGSIRWDTPIAEKWRDFRVADPVVSQQATLRDILCHRTGVGNNESVLYYAMPITRAKLLGQLPNVQQVAPFRTEWRYSNLMYAAAGRVIEVIAGKSWDEHMSERLFQPLGMTRTFASQASLTETQNVAMPHVRVDNETFPTALADQDNIGPAASICSSVSDLSRWLLMMVNEGRYDGKQILRPEVVREMITPQILMPFADPVHGKHNFNAYGLGFMLSDYHEGRIAKHSGMAGHSLAMVGFVPEEHVGVAVLSNHRPGLFHYAVFRRAIDLYCGKPAVDLDSANKILFAQHLARQRQTLQRRADSRNPAKPPTLPLAQYAGTYKREFGIRTTLEMHAGNLVLRYGSFVADVTHWHDDTFRAQLRQRRLAAEQNWYLTFTIDKGSRTITKLHIDSEHDVVADFVRVTESRPDEQPCTAREPE